MSAPIPGDLELLHRICSHYKHNASALKMASLIERIATLEAQVTALSQPVKDWEWEKASWSNSGIKVVDLIIAARRAALDSVEGRSIR